MKIAFVSSEVFPFSKTGGLADVAGALPKALEHLGCEVKIFTPKYYSIDEKKYKLKYNSEIGEIPIRIAGKTRKAHIFQNKLNGTSVEVNFIDCPHYFHRDSFYTDGCDEDERFILFNKSVIEALQRFQWAPDIIHCNDWQTGILPLMLKDNYSWDKLFDKTAVLFTIHNIGYQGKFNKITAKHAEINPIYFYPTGPTEYKGDVSFMKTALSFSDVITTVSKTYADEILTAEFGEGMENILKEKKDILFGILNGIDYSAWNPETDIYLPNKYSLNKIAGKKKNKEFICKKLNLSYDPNIPLIGMVSRMAIQKGFDIFAEVVDDLMKLDAKWVILGSGEEIYEELFTKLMRRFPDKIAVHLGYDNELSHLIEAGADIFLMPSHYEPCGLNQIYSLKYGTIPVVRKTGGLADTVKNWNRKEKLNSRANGFVFEEYSGEALLEAVEEAIAVFKQKLTWRTLQKNGMKADFSWDESAKEYLELYKLAKEKRNDK